MEEHNKDRILFPLFSLSLHFNFFTIFFLQWKNLKIAHSKIARLRWAQDSTRRREKVINDRGEILCGTQKKHNSRVDSTTLYTTEARRKRIKIPFTKGKTYINWIRSELDSMSKCNSREIHSLLRLWAGVDGPIWNVRQQIVGVSWSSQSSSIVISYNILSRRSLRLWSKEVSSPIKLNLLPVEWSDYCRRIMHSQSGQEFEHRHTFPTKRFKLYFFHVFCWILVMFV